MKNKRISMHALRHSLAMELFKYGVDLSVIALWLGHESVESTGMYLLADMAMKERALAMTAPSKTRQNIRYRPDDHLLSVRKSL